MFTARDLASGTMNRLGVQLGGLRTSASATSLAVGRGFAAITAGAAAMAVGLAGLAAMHQLAEIAGDFDQQIAAAGSRARSTAADLALMRQATLDLTASGRVFVGPVQAAEAIGQLGAAGLSARESIAALGPVLGLASAGEIGVESATRAVVAALRVFSLEADNAERVSNQLLAISNSTLLEARDLEAAMGAVGRGATVAGQSIEEMLPAIGLVRNTGVSAEVAAHAVSTSMIYMATHARDRFDQLGVDLVDSTGHFRPLLDIMWDTRTALSGVTDQAERAEQINRLFGRFGMTAFGATEQLVAGIRTQNGVMLQGAAAIAYLREQMANANGTIDYFIDNLLATLPGQLQALKSVAQTIAVELGTPLAAALRPAVSTLIGALQRFRSLWNQLPPSFKEGALQAFMLGSVLLTVFGVVMIGVGAFILLLPVLKVLAVSMLGILLVTVPVGLAFAAAAGFVYLFIRSFTRVSGGIGSLQNRFERFRLIFEGLAQLFGSGVFSGSVMKELNRAENAGIKRFVIRVYMLAYRIEAFFRGVAKGVDIFLEEARPVMQEFIAQVQRLAAVLGISLGGALDDVTKESSKTFGGAGLGLARGMVHVFADMVTHLSKAVDFLQGFYEGIQKTKDNAVLGVIIGLFTILGGAVAWVGSEVFGLSIEFLSARDIGQIAGASLVVMFTILAGVLAIVALSITMIIIGMGILAAVVVGAFLVMLSPVLLFAAAIYTAWRAFKALRGESTPNMTEAVSGTVRDLRAGMVSGPSLAPGQTHDRSGRRILTQRPPAPRTSPGPIELDEARNRSIGPMPGGGWGEIARITTALERRPPPQIAVTTMLDGEVLARHVTQGQRAGADQGFGTTPPGGGE